MVSLLLRAENRTVILFLLLALSYFHLMLVSNSKSSFITGLIETKNMTSIMFYGNAFLESKKVQCWLRLERWIWAINSNDRYLHMWNFEFSHSDPNTRYNPNIAFPVAPNGAPSSQFSFFLSFCFFFLFFLFLFTVAEKLYPRRCCANVGVYLSIVVDSARQLAASLSPCPNNL